jgi:hypothetical protein
MFMRGVKQVAPLVVGGIMLMARTHQWRMVRQVVEGGQWEVLKAFREAGWRCEDTKKGTQLLVTAVIANEYNMVVQLLYAGAEVGHCLMPTPTGWWPQWPRVRTTVLRLACKRADVEVRCTRYWPHTGTQILIWAALDLRRSWRHCWPLAAT